MDTAHSERKPVACERCGFCCIIAPCKFGIDTNTDGRCSYLEIKETIAYCSLLEKGEITKAFNSILEGMSDIRDTTCIKKMKPHHPNLTDRQKLKIALRALRCYANTDMWHWGQGIPKIDNEPYGGKNGQDTHKYNAFGIAPDQDGWELAQSTLDEIGER